MRRFFVFLCAGASLLGVRPLLAQTPPVVFDATRPEVAAVEAPAAAGSSPRIPPSVRLARPSFPTAATPVVPQGRDDTILLESLSGQAVIRLGTNVQFDVRGFPDGGPDGGPDMPFVLRRIRPVVAGAVGRNVQFRFMPDFAGGKAEVFDAYLDLGPQPVRLMAGKFKTPFGLERLQNATNLTFVERGLSDALVPNRDVGVQIHGEPLGPRLRYTVALLNGAPGGGSAEAENDDKKDVAAHVFVHPVIASWGRVGLGAAGTWGGREGSATATQLAPYRTSAQHSFFQYNKGVFASGATRRVTAHGYVYIRRFGLMGDVVAVSEGVAGDKLPQGRLQHLGWQVQATFHLTDDEARFDGVTPRSPVGQGGLGSWALSGRVDGLTLDKKAFEGAATDGSFRGARGYTYGLTWVPDNHFRVQVEHVITALRAAPGKDNKTTEHAVLARLGARF